MGYDTAMDCVRTAVRQTPNQLNVCTEEIGKICLDLQRSGNAIEEGVEFCGYLVQKNSLDKKKEG